MMLSLVDPRVMSSAVGVQLLRELQQHRLYALVEASLKEKSQQEMAKKGLANGRFDRTTPHHYSSGWHDAERVMVYLLLAPVTSWEAVQSQVRVQSQMKTRKSSSCVHLHRVIWHSMLCRLQGGLIE